MKKLFVMALMLVCLTASASIMKYFLIFSCFVNTLNIYSLLCLQR